MTSRTYEPQMKPRGAMIRAIRERIAEVDAALNAIGAGSKQGKRARQIVVDECIQAADDYIKRTYDGATQAQPDDVAGDEP